MLNDLNSVESLAGKKTSKATLQMFYAYSQTPSECESSQRVEMSLTVTVFKESLLYLFWKARQGSWYPNGRV